MHAIRNPYEYLVEQYADFLVKWLREVGEVRAAVWFKKNWCGENGQYMLAHCGVGVTPCQNGLESSWRYLKAATSDKRNVSLSFFLSSLFHYMQEKSKEMRAALDLEFGYIHSFSESPVLERPMWESLQSMHRHTLAMTIVLDVSASDVAAWTSVIDDVLDEEMPWHGKHFVECLMSQAESLGAPTDKRRRRLTASSCLTLLVPGQKWFKYFDPDNVLTLQQLNDIMHGRTGARGADGQDIAEIDYHSKFLRICKSGDVEQIALQDQDLCSFEDALGTYHQMDIMPQAWKCEGAGMCMSLAVCLSSTHPVCLAQVFLMMRQARSITHSVCTTSVAVSHFTSGHAVSTQPWQLW